MSGSISAPSGAEPRRRSPRRAPAVPAPFSFARTKKLRDAGDARETHGTRRHRVSSAVFARPLRPLRYHVFFRNSDDRVRSDQGLERDEVWRNRRVVFVLVKMWCLRFKDGAGYGGQPAWHDPTRWICGSVAHRWADQRPMVSDLYRTGSRA